jgi:propionate CoA-transferase
MTVILPRLPAILHVTSVTQTHSCKLLSRVVATGLVSCQRCFYSSNHRDNSLDYDHGGLQQAKSGYRLPQRRRNKVVTAEDAVSLVKSGDTVCVSGFVCQGAPEHLLKALGDYYDEHGTPHSLTLLFGGGPGDYGERGLNHLAKEKAGCEPMLIRTIGGHYGQVPKVAALALAEKIEAHVLPMGSISRMIRAQASHSPGHITTVGLNTFLDPETGNGGAVNETALKSQLHKELITRIKIHGQDYLMYKALPIDVAIIRATTADSMGNLTVEDESLLCDQMITAAAARNSGGIVIAQVKRLAAVGSLPTRQVAVPGPLVDCVVVVDEDLHARDHAMSYLTVHDPFLTNQIRSPSDFLEKMELNERKVIARRAAMMLEPGKFVNLGIGLPDGVASVAAEEGLLKFITLTTEPGVVGGLPASGHEFGPAANADALIEMNQMFDFYNGGILDICMLGATEISPQGDVNVSRIGMNKLTGPG